MATTTIGTASTAARLRLASVAGPERIAREIAPGSVHRVGRAIASEICLLHQNVSRRHASIADHHGAWFLTDLGSRHGTTLNGVRLEPDRPGRLATGDLIQIGPWTFRIDVGDETATSVATIDDSSLPAHNLESVRDRDLGSLARQRLSLLIECAAEINAAADEIELARAVLRAALAATGFARAAYLRPLGLEHEVELVAASGPDGAEPHAFAFSRSLISRAAGGELVRLSRTAELAGSHSIAELGIHSAICAPVMLDASTAAYIYLDARGCESQVHRDATEFCQALARMAGLALGSIKRGELLRRQRLLEAELDAAREAQRLILPPPEGSLGGITYTLRMQPGMVVAGDLFDVVRLGEDRVAVAIGDVTGEGVGAALLMASAQSQLHAVLRHAPDLAEAIGELNVYLVEHSAANRFISMWVGILDRSARTLSYVDAGHGHWTMRPDGGDSIDRRAGGIPLGIDETFAYEVSTIPFPHGRRLVLYSDGIVEQRNPQNESFGRARVDAILAGTSSAKDDASRLFESLLEFAQTPSLDDDTTVAGIEWT